MDAVLQRQSLFLVRQVAVCATWSRTSRSVPRHCLRMKQSSSHSLPEPPPQNSCTHIQRLRRSLLPLDCYTRNLVTASCWNRRIGSSWYHPIRWYARDTSHKAVLERRNEKLTNRKEKKDRKVVEIKEKMSILELAIAMDVDLGEAFV